MTKDQRKQEWKRISKLTLDEAKSELEKLNKTSYNIITAKVKKETDAYRMSKDEDLDGIDVADGGKKR